MDAGHDANGNGGSDRMSGESHRKSVWKPTDSPQWNCARKDARQHGMFRVLWRQEQDVEAAMSDPASQA